MFASKKITVVLLLLTLAVFWKIKLHSFVLGQVQLWDFDIYYQLAKDVLNGQNLYEVSYMQTAGPPAVLIFFLPFTFLPLMLARGVMISLSVVMAFLSCQRLVHTYLVTVKGSGHFNATLFLNFLFWLSFLPRYNLNVGQPNIVIMYLVTIILTTQQAKLKSFCLAAMVLLKSFFVFTLVGMVSSQFKVVMMSCLGIFLLVALSLPFLKPSFYQEYVQQRLGGYLSTQPVISDVDYYNQSLRSTTARLSLGHWYGGLALVLFLVGGAAVFMKQDVAAGIVFSLLISPVLWQHYLVVVYPIIFVTLYQLWWRQKFSWLLVLASIMLCMHLPWLHGSPVTILNGVLASHFYFALLLLFIVRLRMPADAALEN